MKYPFVFSCHITNYKIEYIINDSDKVAIINTIICDYKNLKAFFSLLRTSIDKLMKKEIISIRQVVSFDEWNDYLKNNTTWQIINTDNVAEIYDIECKIEDFLQNFGVGIGIFE